MASRTFNVDQLTAEERIDPAAAAPITPALAEELDRSEAEADADPSAGEPWTDIKADLRRRPR